MHRVCVCFGLRAIRDEKDVEESIACALRSGTGHRVHSPLPHVHSALFFSLLRILFCFPRGTHAPIDTCIVSFTSSKSVEHFRSFSSSFFAYSCVLIVASFPACVDLSIFTSVCRSMRMARKRWARACFTFVYFRVECSSDKKKNQMGHSSEIKCVDTASTTQTAE